MTSFKIHPSIGVARVGNSEEYYLGPETAGGVPMNLDGTPVTSSQLRDAQGKVKRQAARFEVYRYEGPDPTPVSATHGDIEAIEWTVHLANKKAVWYEFHTHQGSNGYSPDHPLRNAKVKGDARRRLIIDAGPGRLKGPNQRKDFSRNAPKQPEFADYPVNFPPEHLTPYTIDSLGSMITDDKYGLHVVGGYGHSGSERQNPTLPEYANNDGWYDDTSDGPVTATVIMKDGTRIEATPAWVMVAPPSYAPEILNMVTLYDTMYDIAVRELGYRPHLFKDGLWNPEYRPNFFTEILPILRRGIAFNWVVNIPNVPHTFTDAMLKNLGNPDPRYNALRHYFLDVFRSPDDPNVFMSERGTPLMPFLAGDGALEHPRDTAKYQTLTRTQYFLFLQWARGIFSNDDDPIPEDLGDALDRAVLSNLVGAAFSPGIEMSWNCRKPQIYSAPFRLEHKGPIGKIRPSPGEDGAGGMEPGDATKYMAIPWQADFNECAAQDIEHFTEKGSHVNWVWWWPAQRPIMVFADQNASAGRQFVAWVGQIEDHTRDDYMMCEDNLEMVHAWKELGFVYNVGTKDEPNFVEVARLAPRDLGVNKDKPLGEAKK